jgi:PAS domain S-box-containing protein
MDEQAQQKRPRHSPPKAQMSAEDLPRLLSRLQQYQLELELQNFELRLTCLSATATPEQQAQVYNSASGGFVDLDTQGFVRNLNRSAASLLNAQRTEIIGKKFTDFVLPPDVAKFESHREQCEAARQKISVELRLQPRASQFIDAQLLCFPPPDSAARNCRLVLADITELKRAEAKFSRLAAFPALNPNPIIELAEDGEVTWFNEAAQVLSNFLGQENPCDILPPQSAECVRECLATKRSRLRKEMIIGDHHLLW